MKKKRRWKEDEEEYLKEAWGNVSITTLQRDLKRTKESIKIKATRLNLGGAKTNSYKYISTGEVARILKIDRCTPYKWIKKGWLQGKYMALSKNQKIWCIKYDDFLKFLKNNPGRWDGSKVEEYALGYEYDWLIKKRNEDKKGVKSICG